MTPGVTLHARERMAERYGRDLTAGEWLRLVGSILIDRTAVLLARSRRGEIYAVGLDAMTFIVVWRPDLGSVVTVLPPYRRA